MLSVLLTGTNSSFPDEWRVHQHWNESLRDPKGLCPKHNPQHKAQEALAEHANSGDPGVQVVDRGLYPSASNANPESRIPDPKCSD